MTISVAFDSKDVNILNLKKRKKNTNSERTPNEVGLQIKTQDVLFLLQRKKNTLINPLNQSVFCLYLMQLRPVVINIIHIQCFLYVHLILEYNSVDTYECSSFLGTT